MATNLNIPKFKLLNMNFSDVIPYFTFYKDNKEIEMESIVDGLIEFNSYVFECSYVTNDNETKILK